MTSGIPFSQKPVLQIVADFEFEGQQFLVVLWDADENPEHWQVYLADYPWYWKSLPHEDLRG